PSMQTRFARLEEMRVQINAQPMEGQTWFREVLRKLDYLLEKFLQFAGKEAQFRSYLQSLLDETRGGASRSVSAEEVGFDLGDDRPARRGRMDSPRASRVPQPSRPAAWAPPSLEREERWAEETIVEVQAHYDAEMS